MHLNIKYIFLVIFLAFIKMNGIAQDPQFSQFYSAPLYLAPSFAGTTEGGRIITNYRDQWPKLRATYITYSFSADYYFSKYRSGVGLLVLRDQAGHGLLNKTNLGLNYSFNFDINRKWKFRPGLQAYYYWKNIDFNILRFGDQILRGGSSTPSVEMECCPSTKCRCRAYRTRDERVRTSGSNSWTSRCRTSSACTR